jgi:serine/threonine protein phosphatase PrpC
LVQEAKKAYAFEKTLISQPKDFLQTVVDNTRKSLQLYVDKNPDTDPQTTCVLALVQDGIVYSAHIGDSRLYIFNEEGFVFRTKDHSVVQMLVNLGEITEEEMGTHPDQNRLLKSISCKKDVEISYKEIELSNEKTNVVFACSDGFWEYLSVEEMQKYLFSMSLDQALVKMVALTKERAGKSGDNISVAAFMSEKKVETTTQKIIKFLNKDIF